MSSNPFSPGKLFWNAAPGSGATVYSGLIKKPRLKQFLAALTFTATSGTFAGTLSLMVPRQTLEEVDAAERLSAAALTALKWIAYAPTGFSLPAISTAGVQDELVELVDFAPAVCRFKFVDGGGGGTGTILGSWSGQG